MCSYALMALLMVQLYPQTDKRIHLFQYLPSVGRYRCPVSSHTRRHNDCISPACDAVAITERYGYMGEVTPMVTTV